MKMTTSLALTSLTLLLSACNWFSGGDDDSSSGPVDDAVAGFGEACQNDYYRELIGTYQGEAIYDISTTVPSSSEMCTWTINARVEVDSDTLACQLRMVISSELEQSIVLPAIDENAYQCIEENSVRGIDEPNQSSDPSSFENVRFPVVADFDHQITVPNSGPYFGDEAADVRYVYLLDSTTAVADIIQFDGSGVLRFLSSGGSSSQVLNAVLEKE